MRRGGQRCGLPLVGWAMADRVQASLGRNRRFVPQMRGSAWPGSPSGTSGPPSRLDARSADSNAATHAKNGKPGSFLAALKANAKRGGALRPPPRPKSPAQPLNK